MPKKVLFAHVNQSTRRDGTIVYYHRKDPDKLPCKFAKGSREFMQWWLEAERRAGNALAVKLRATVQGSYGQLWEDFQGSEDFIRLADRTKEDYLKVRDWMFSKGGETLPAKDLTQKFAEEIIDTALHEKKVRFAGYVLQVNRRLFNWVLKKFARKSVYGSLNPFTNLDMPSGPRKILHRPWTAQEFSDVINAAPLGLARAFVLGISGYDSKTAYEVKWTHYHDGIVTLNRTKTDVAGASIIPDVCRPYLDNGDRPSEYVITRPDGQRFPTLNALQKTYHAHLKTISEDLTFHGLRHTMAMIIAENGGSLHAIQQALQHRTANMALHYSSQADRKKALRLVSSKVNDWFLLQRDLDE